MDYIEFIISYCALPARINGATNYPPAVPRLARSAHYMEAVHRCIVHSIVADSQSQEKVH